MLGERGIEVREFFPDFADASNDGATKVQDPRQFAGVPVLPFVIRACEQYQSKYCEANVPNPCAKQWRDLRISGYSGASGEDQVVQQHQNQTDDQAHGFAAPGCRDAQRQCDQRK